MIVGGQLYLFSYAEDVAAPCLEAIFNPGDIVGLPEISKGWSLNQHDWLVAYNKCDIFMTSKEYMKYMWWNMKKNTSNKVVDLLDNNENFKILSEQTRYTIAHDIAKFREYKPGETIVRQDINSYYNINHKLAERKMMDNLKNQDAEYIETKQRVYRENYPKITKRWNEVKHDRLYEKQLIANKKEKELIEAQEKARRGREHA